MSSGHKIKSISSVQKSLKMKARWDTYKRNAELVAEQEAELNKLKSEVFELKQENLDLRRERVARPPEPSVKAEEVNWFKSKFSEIEQKVHNLMSTKQAAPKLAEAPKAEAPKPTVPKYLELKPLHPPLQRSKSLDYLLI